MNLEFKIHWILNSTKEREIDPSLFRILLAVRKERTLKNSAASTGLSYRHAWGLIKKWETEFGKPLLTLERGRGKGARLTEFGEKLIWAEQYMNEQLAPALDTLKEELTESLSEYIYSGSKPGIRIFASHGMAIALLHDQLKDDDRFNMDFQIHGSLESLENLNSGHCQAAGFHLPLQIVGDIVAPKYRQWLINSRHLLLMVAVRDQGILVKSGNPKKIQALDDLTKRSVRFINRQLNSGTRTIFDQLLKQSNIDSRDIKGYTNEEFTHVAVAAMIASGAADAGFGIQAAAEKFNLGFIPILQEAYVLAIEKSLNPVIKNAIKKQLKSADFRNKVNKLAGYNANNSGTELSFQQLLGNN